MTLSERDQIYVEHMLECIERVERFAYHDRNTFMRSDLVQDAVVRNLQTLSESSQRLSDEVKNTQSHIDWRAITGFRNILVHDYILDWPGLHTAPYIAPCPVNTVRIVRTNIMRSRITERFLI